MADVEAKVKRKTKREKKTISAFECDPSFCGQCGSILPLPGLESYITCKVCGFQYDVSVFESVEIHSFKTYNHDKLNRFKIKDLENEVEDSGPVTKRKCSKCGHDKMTYITRQTRSADEGQTVFYTCVNCKFKETEYS